MAILSQHQRLYALATLMLAMLALLWHPSSSQAKPPSIFVTNKGSGEVMVFCAQGSRETAFRRVQPGTAEEIPVPIGGGGACWTMGGPCQWFFYVEPRDTEVCKKKCYSILSDDIGFYRRNGHKRPWEAIKPICMEEDENHDYDYSQSQYKPKD